MIIGRPQNIDGFEPLNPAEFAYLRQPIEQALQQGIPLEQQIGVDFVVVCRLLKTVIAMSGELQRVLAEKTAAAAAADQPAPVASLSEDLTDPVVAVGAAEEPPLPFIAGRTPVVLTEE